MSMTHRNPKAEEDLILDDKLDAVRTLTRLKARSKVRRELNELESRVVEAHRQELTKGKVTRLELNPSAIFGEADNDSDSA